MPFTEVKIEKSKWRLDKESRILMLGSCFTTNIGGMLEKEGFNPLVNPFGVLFNPASIAASFKRMASREPFRNEDVINIGFHTTNPKIGDKSLPVIKYCSFFHHSSLARETGEAFLKNANDVLEKSSDFLEKADTLIITLGTSWVFRHIERGYIVSNCHKINPREFRREFLSAGQTAGIIGEIVGRFPDKHFIFTVSPIRHFKDGAHGNQISKASLLLAVDKICSDFHNVEYFPSYEIMLDELRDYIYYAEDMVHPSERAIEHIYRRFKECFINR